MSDMIPLTKEIDLLIKKELSVDSYLIYQLAGDASARKYYRVIDQDKTYVLMVWEPFDESKYPFLNVLNHFKLSEVHVPEAVIVNGALGIILLEDLGDLTLERKFWEATKPESSWGFYKKSLDEIIKIHTTATQLNHPTIAKELMFDVPKFMWEMNYAKTHLLEGLLKHSMSPAVLKELDQTFLDFCTKLHNEPKVICHRDYHSRNLMIKLDKMFVIDFQDARLGPIQYDLVSLLKDSYVDISDEYAHQMLNYYFENTPFVNSSNKDHFYNIYELQSIQRCFKACGSFASFMNTRQDKRYLKYLTPTLKRVMRSLGHFPEYKILNDILIDSGALEKNYGQM